MPQIAATTVVPPGMFPTMVFASPVYGAGLKNMMLTTSTRAKPRRPLGGNENVVNGGALIWKYELEHATHMAESAHHAKLLFGVVLGRSDAMQCIQLAGNTHFHSCKSRAHLPHCQHMIVKQSRGLRTSS